MELAEQDPLNTFRPRLHSKLAREFERGTDLRSDTQRMVSLHMTGLYRAGDIPEMNKHSYGASQSVRDLLWSMLCHYN
jgi:hypothetical protein